MSEDRRDARGRQRGAARAGGGARPRTAQAPAQRRRDPDAARAVAYDLLRLVREEDAYANLTLPALLRERRLGGRDAAFATELAYGTLRLQGYYDAVLGQVADRGVDAIDAPVLDVLRLGVHQLLGMRVPAHAAVSETVALARARVGTGPSQFVNALLRRVAERSPQEWDEVLAEQAHDETERLATRYSHPAWVVRALRQALLADGRHAAELEELLEADNRPADVTLVVRPGLADRGEVLQTVAGSRPGRWTSTAVVMSGGDPGDVPGVAEGRVAVQDEGSQLVALALAAVEIRPAGEGAPSSPSDRGDGAGERWLDMSAGPGGKAALLGALAAQRGAHLVANELQPHRARLVERSLLAVPQESVEVRCGDGRGLSTDEPQTYDRVLLDAPCTGLGALRRRPEARWRRRPADLPPLTTLQRELLTSGLDALAPGGVLAYVTCSPHVAETSLVVHDALRKRPELEVLDARDVVRQVAGDEIPLGPGPAVQLWPHVHGTDAMHLTLIRRRPAPGTP